jgi:multidrug efflux pump subunit AcrA (membrane-fusion protein)
MVYKGDKLLRIANPAIEQEYEAARKAVEASQAQIDPIVKALNVSLQSNEREQLKAQLAELEVRHSELVAAETDAERKFLDLTVTSPVSGLITALDASLLNKQIEPGQQLATIKASKWEVELILPESNVGHVTSAQARMEEHLPASFVLQTEPGTYYYGWLREVEKAAQVYEDQVHGVKTHITLNPDAQPADRRPGATAKVSINCGSHSVGYVLFHKAIEWAQINVFF